MPLADELQAAKDEVERIDRAIAQASCQEIAAHDMRHIGGCNAGCGDDCRCSIPVHVCARCGDCDYGDNPEADQKKADCARRRAA